MVVSLTVCTISASDIATTW